MLRITVGKGGEDYLRIQDAVNAVPYDTPAEIVISGGVYHEKIFSDKADLSIRGSGDVYIINSDSALETMERGEKRGTFRSYTAFFGGGRLRQGRGRFLPLIFTNRAKDGILARLNSDTHTERNPESMRMRAFAALTLAAALVLSGCGVAGGAGEEEPRRLTVLATTYPVYLLANHFGSGFMFYGIGIGWCAGFFMGIFQGASEKLVLSDVAHAALSVIASYIPDDTFEFSEEEKTARELWDAVSGEEAVKMSLADALYRIVEAAYRLKAEWNPNAPVRNTAARVGRNDPCPCGSGKKYKQCCGKK